MGEYIYNLAEGAERPQQIREVVANVSIPGRGGGVRCTPINFGWMCAAKGLKMLTPVRMRETQKICVLRSKPEK